METNQIKSYLSVCEDAPIFEVKGKSFHPGSRQEFYEVELDILDEDVLSISIPGHIKMQVGGASGIKALSIRYCGDKGSIIPQYHDSEKNLLGCCICCSGWCIYGDYGCACG